MSRVLLSLFFVLPAAALFAQGQGVGAQNQTPAASRAFGGPAGGGIADQHRATPQTGTGRLNATRDVGQMGRAGERGRPLFDRRSDALGRRNAEIRSAENPSAKRRQNEPRQPNPANLADPSRMHPPQSQRPWAAEHVLQNRLAAIDRMRDHALTSENLDLLHHADELEQMAREQHARMTGILPPAPVALPGFTPLPPSTATAASPISTAADPAPLPPTNTGVAPASVPPPGPYVPPGLHGREFGQHVSEQARLYGREWGQFVSEQAQQGGTPFGRGIDRRNFEPPIVIEPPMTIAPPVVTQPPTFPEPGTAVQP